MSTPFTPTRAVTALLYHHGDLRDNVPNPQVVPSAFQGLDDNVVAGAVPGTVAGPYVPPDAGAVVASGYDELIIDVQPLVRPDGSVGAVSATTQNAFRQAAMTARPYWIVVRCDGYGVQALATRTGALQAALAVVTWAQQHARSLLVARRLRGMAFVAPDLNVTFPDGSVIDRQFQNQLVQACWSLGLGATIITDRPADQLGLVGPPLTNTLQEPNSNSGAVLPWAIIGTNPAVTDRIVLRYPVAQLDGYAPGVLATMVAGLLGARGRDGGVALQLDVGLVAPLVESTYAPDGVVGTVLGADHLPRVMALAAALGVRVLGVETTSTVPASSRFVPPDAGVNTTGALAVDSTDAVLTVRYPDATGASAQVVRRFDPDLREIAAPS